MNLGGTGLTSEEESGFEDGKPAALPTGAAKAAAAASAAENTGEDPGYRGMYEDLVSVHKETKAEHKSAVENLKKQHDDEKQRLKAAHQEDKKNLAKYKKENEKLEKRVMEKDNEIAQLRKELATAKFQNKKLPAALNKKRKQPATEETGGKKVNPNGCCFHPTVASFLTQWFFFGPN